MNEYLDLCRDLNSKEDNDQKSKEKFAEYLREKLAKKKSLDKFLVYF